MRYDEFLKSVRERTGLGDNEATKQVVESVLEVLGQRLSGQEPSDFAGQLPQELKALLDKHSGTAETFDAEAFVNRVAAQEGNVPQDQAREHIKTVLGVIQSFVSSGELQDIRSQLPPDYGTFFE